MLLIKQLSITAKLFRERRCEYSAALNTMVYLSFQYKCFRGYCNFAVVVVSTAANRLDISVDVCVGLIFVTKLLSLDLSRALYLR